MSVVVQQVSVTEILLKQNFDCLICLEVKYLRYFPIGVTAAMVVFTFSVRPDYRQNFWSYL